jgi:hypothetical protein
VSQQATGPETPLELRVLAHAEQAQAYGNIAELVDNVRRCQTLAQYRDIQQQLGAHVERVDEARAQARLRESEATTRGRRMRRRANGADAAELDKLEEDAAAARFDQDLYKWLGYQYRTVGDALAWQLYGFNTLPLRTLGLNQSPGPIAGKAGASVESEAVERHWREEGAFALRHDFTNTIRIWDLSIFKPGSPIFIEEVKSPGGEVKSRQKARGRLVEELTTTRVATDANGRLLVHTAIGPSPVSDVAHTNLGLLQDAMLEMHEHGVGIAANSYLAVMVVDLRHHPVSAEHRARAEAFLTDVPAPLRSPLCPDYLRATTSEKVIAAGKGAPFSVYPLFPVDVAAIVTGYIRVHIVLNTEAIVEGLRGAGFEARCLLAENRNDPNPTMTDYFHARRDDIAVTIHKPTVQQVLFEGLTLEHVVASTVELYERLRDKPMPITPGERAHRPIGTLATYADMEQVWRACLQFIVPDENASTEEAGGDTIDGPGRL